MRIHLVLMFLLLVYSAGLASDTLVAASRIYRFRAGSMDGLTVWIVDGAVIRRDIYPEFLYGGNAQRYRFVPEGEIWIDNAIAAEEFAYTVAHELRERMLMARKGISYAAAHDSALTVERFMRPGDRKTARDHERRSPRVTPRDSDGAKEIRSLPASINLRNIYRAPLGTRNGLTLWVVDGATVRRDVFPDFGLSGNDMAYRFIPHGEIWIDGQISCEETEYSIVAELKERTLMAGGKSYDDAYEQALADVAALRLESARAAELKAPIRLSIPLDRDVGTGDEPSGIEKAK